MSLNAIRWAWQQNANGLTKLVLLALANEADEHGTKCYPSIRYLAEKCGISPSSVQSAIKELEQGKLIVVMRPKRRGPGHFNSYLLSLEVVPATGTELSTTDPPVGTSEHLVVPELYQSGPLVVPATGTNPIDPITRERFQKDIPRPKDGLARMPAPRKDCSACDSTGWKELTDGSVIPCSACKQVG